MIEIDKEFGEIKFRTDSDHGSAHGRISYFCNMLDEITFTMTGRTVPEHGDVKDIAALLIIIGHDLMEAETNPQPDAGSEEVSEGQGFSLA